MPRQWVPSDAEKLARKTRLGLARPTAALTPVMAAATGWVTVRAVRRAAELEAAWVRLLTVCPPSERFIAVVQAEVARRRELFGTGQADAVESVYQDVVTGRLRMPDCLTTNQRGLTDETPPRGR